MKTRFLLLSLLLLQLQPAQASHVLGGEMNYRCLGNGQFEFTVIFYRDCTGISWNQTAVNVNGPTGTFNLPRVAVTDISPRCATATTFACGGNPVSGTGPNGSLSKFTYKDTVNLGALAAPPAAGYMFSCSDITVNVRNSVNNMSAGSSLGLRLIMYPYIDPATGVALSPAALCDQGPEFLDDPLAVHVLNPLDTARVFHAAFDKDMDSLAYAFDFPLTAALTPMFYLPPYTVAAPFPNTPSVVVAGQPLLQPLTGMLSFRPSVTGGFLSCVAVHSWRGNNRISSVFRDFQVRLITQPAGSTPPYNPSIASTQRAPILTTIPADSLGQPIKQRTYYVGDTINLGVNVSDYFPATQASNQQPLTASPFDVVFKSLALSSTNDENAGCLFPPCATLRGLSDAPAPAPVATQPVQLFAGNGQASGMGYAGDFVGGGRIGWLPTCSSLGTIASAKSFQFVVNGIDKNCTIEGRDQLSLFIHLLPLPEVTPPNLTGISAVGGQFQLNFVTSFDTLSIDPVDVVNYADSSVAYQRSKSVNRRYASFQSYQVFKSVVRTGPYQLAAAITNPFETSWVDTTGTLGQFYFIATVSSCNTRIESSDTLSTCQTQTVVVSAPAGPYYCPSTGTLLQATGNPSGSLQWYKEGLPIAGATATSYLVMADGDYVLGVTDAAGCQSFSALQSMQPANTPYEGEEICAVTVDLQSGFNKVLWVKTANQGIPSYLISRENIQTGIYDPIAVVPFADAGIFVDSFANSQAQPARYKIQAQDVCSRNSNESPAHRSMHLQANPTSATTVSLSWTAYEGQVVGYYTILRSTGGVFNTIGTTSATTFNYVDQLAPSGPKVYLIWLSNLTLCNVGTGINPLYSNAVSLGSGVSTEQLNDTKFKVYPNPTSGQLRVESNHSIQRLFIRDMQGRLILMVQPNAETYDLNLSALSKGVYIVEIEDENERFYQRLVLQ